MSIDVGTADPNGIIHSGSTTGDSNVEAGDNHTIYMVAVPKNSAIQMLLSGTIGFDEAVTAGVENGEIILRAGRWFDGTTNFASSYNSSMTIGGAQGAATFTSDVRAATTHSFDVLATTADVDFYGDLSVSNALSFTATNTNTLSAINGNAISVDGDLTLLRLEFDHWFRDHSRGFGRRRHRCDRRHHPVRRPGRRRHRGHDLGRLPGQRFDHCLERNRLRQCL